MTLVSVEPSVIVQGTVVQLTFKGSGFVPQQTFPEIPAVDRTNPPCPDVPAGVQFVDDATMTMYWCVTAPAGKYYVDVSRFSSALRETFRSNALPFTVLPLEIRAPEYRVSTFAGKPGGAGSADGPRQATRFAGTAQGLRDDGKVLYIASNHTIRKRISPRASSLLLPAHHISAITVMVTATTPDLPLQRRFGEMAPISMCSRMWWAMRESANSISLRAV